MYTKYSMFKGHLIRKKRERKREKINLSDLTKLILTPGIMCNAQHRQGTRAAAHEFSAEAPGEQVRDENVVEHTHEVRVDRRQRGHPLRLDQTEQPNLRKSSVKWLQV